MIEGHIYPTYTFKTRLSFSPSHQLLPNQPQWQLEVHEGEPKREPKVATKLGNQVEGGVGENVPGNCNGLAKHEHQSGI